MNELPTLMSATYGGVGAANMMYHPMGGGADVLAPWNQPFKQAEPDDFGKKLGQFIKAQQAQAAAPQPQKEAPQMNQKRLVRVVMVDPHKDVPPESSLIYDSKEVFTDKTDQELFFDMPVAQLLKDHNEKRTKIVNKDVKDRTEYLEPARVSHLKMLVVTLATF